MPVRRRQWLLAAALLVGLPFLTLVMFGPILDTMLYPAPRLRVGEPPPGLTELTIDAEPGVRTEPGAHLVAWAGGDRATPGRPAALFLHGNGENLETMRRAGLFARLDRLDAAYLALDYPGYGRSGGEPGEAALVAGAEAALDRLRVLHPGRPLVVVGWSLGAAVAVQLAARRPAALDGVVLLSPWSRLADTAAAHFPGLVVRPLVGDRYDSLAAAPQVTAPALVIHGERDHIIPARQGEQLAAALGERDGVETRWVPVAGAGHNDLLGQEVVWAELAHFLDAAGR